MSTEKSAVVRFRVEGDDEVSRAAGRVQSAWQTAGSAIGSAFKGVGSAIGSAVQGVLSDLGHVVSAAGAINFASSIAQVQRFEDAVTRLGVGSGRSIAEVQGNMNALGRSIGEMPDATAGWVTAVGQLTYSYEGAAEAAKGMAEYAALTGQTLSQVQGLAVALGQSGLAAGDTAGAMGTMVAQARALNTVGGPKALVDMFQHMQGQVSQLAASDGINKVGALMAGFGGPKGFTPQQRERALSGVMGKIESDPLGFERFLGHSIRDEYGHIKDMTGTIKELGQYAGKGAYQKQRMEFTVGAESNAALLHTDWKAIADAEKMNPSDEAAAALDRAKSSAAGKRQAAEIGKSIAMQGSVGSDSLLGKAQQYVRELASDNPLLTGAGLLVGGKLAGSAASGLGSALFGGGGGAAAAGGGGAAATGGAGGGGLLAGFAGPALAAAGLGLGFIAADRAIYGKTYAAMQQGDDAYKLNVDQYGRRTGDIKTVVPNTAGERTAMIHRGTMVVAKPGEDFGRLEQRGVGGVTAGDQAMIQQLTKMGATMENISQMLQAQAQGQPIQIVNHSGGRVDAKRRGQQ